MVIDEFFKLASGQIPGPIRVGSVKPSVRDSLGASASAVWLSKDSLDKTLSRHHNIERYFDKIDFAVETGVPFRVPSRRVAMVVDTREVTDERFNVVIKATGRLDELYVLSFYPLRERDWKRIVRKHNEIF